MSDKTISQLDASTLPLAGTEVLPIVQSGVTKKVASDDLTVKNVRSNATSGVLQVAGPATGRTRVMTVPDADFTVAKTADKLNVFAATTSAELAGVISDETGSGALVFGTNPTISGATVTGGTINNTPIGNATPSTGDFSVLTEAGVAVVVQTDIGTAPNQVPLNQNLGNLAYQNSDQLVVNPVASATPHQVGDMVFQLTSDTSLEIKVRGSDGTVRSVALTLA